jgi:propanol-preferring alcohol dehydrogenase
MVLQSPGQPLRAEEVPVPEAGRGQLLLRVRACAVCRTDLHIVDGELPSPKLALISGHEIAGRVAAVGQGVTSFKPGDRA